MRDPGLTNPTKARAAPRDALVALAALAGFVAYLLAFFPGALTFDGAYQWWQARGGETSSVHAPAMTWLWRAGEWFGGGPGPLFVLQLALLWTGLAALALRLPWNTAARAAFVLAGGGLPICWALYSAVLSDAMLAGVLCCAVALLAVPSRSRARFGAVVVLLGTAVLLRKNAAPAVVPLLVLLSAQQFRMRTVVHATVAGALALAMQAGASLADRSVDRPASLFPTLALWDLAALSIASNTVLLPPATHGPDLTVADLAQAYTPYSCVSLFARTQGGIVQPFFLDAAVQAGVREAWREAIAARPGAYLAHRWRVTRALFGGKAADWPRELVYFTGAVQYRDNPPVTPNASPLNRAWIGLLDASRSTIVLAAWPWLLVLLAALVPAWRARHAAAGALALAVLASGLAYALPLPVIAPSAELRYLGWTCLAAYLGGALALAAHLPRGRVQSD